MIDKLRKIQEKFLKIEDELASGPDPSKLKELYKERSRLTPLYENIQEFFALQKNIDDAKLILETEKDSEMRRMLETELEESEDKIETLKLPLYEYEPGSQGPEQIKNIIGTIE